MPNDPIAVATEEETPSPAPVEPAAKPDASNADIVTALEGVKAALTKPGEPPPTRAQIREALKERTGFSDPQLDVVEQMTVSAANASTKKTAELEAKVAWNEFKDEAGGKIDPAVEKIMQDELKQYEPQYRGDKELLRKIHFMAKGIIADKLEKARKANPDNNDNPNDNPNIHGRTIVTDIPAPAGSLENNGKPKGGAGALNDEEKSVAKKMNISEADYALSKTTKIVSQLKGSIK